MNRPERFMTSQTGGQKGPAKYGKPNDSSFEAVFRHLGARAEGILVPPARGFDNGVLKLGPDSVLVFTADPISFIPSLGARMSAWLSLHHLASDLATSGVKPRYAMMDYNLPGDFSDANLRGYLSAFSDESRSLGISIVGGHTGRYPGCGLTVIGAGFLFAEAPSTGYITPSMAHGGDRVLITKGPAIEATAVLALSFSSRTKEALGPGVLAKAKRRLLECSTVEDSLLAASVGLRDDGVTSMHDATEGGVVTALGEMAAASGKEIAADLSLLPVPEDIGKVCSLFGLNPYETLSEGTLVITCRPAKVGRLMGAFRRRGIGCFEVGEVKEGMVGDLRKERGVRLAPKKSPVERYWDVYARGIEEGWS